MKKFKLDNAEEWCSFITCRNKVYAVPGSFTEDFLEFFFNAISDLPKKIKSQLIEHPSVPGFLCGVTGFESSLLKR